jgi:hypothetical protein
VRLKSPKYQVFCERGKISKMIELWALIGPLPSWCGSTHWLLEEMIVWLGTQPCAMIVVLTMDFRVSEVRRAPLR